MLNNKLCNLMHPVMPWIWAIKGNAELKEMLQLNIMVLYTYIAVVQDVQYLLEKYVNLCFLQK
jgi:hypothetical protein